MLADAPHSLALPINWEQRMASLMLFLTILFSVLPAGLEWIAYEDFADQVQGGSWRFQAQWLFLFGIAYFIFFRNFYKALKIIKSTNPFLLLMLFYTGMNIFWSAVPEISIKRVFQFFGLFIIAISLQIADKNPKKYLYLLLFSITSIIFFSTVVAIIYPTLGHDVNFGTAWRGILNTKNDLGSIGAVGVILWFIWTDTYSKKWVLFFLFGGLSLLSIVKATSSTGIATSFLGLFIYIIFRRSYLQSPLWLLRLFVIFLLFFIIGMHWFFIYEGRPPSWSEVIGPFAAFFGKSTDLTGRTVVWDHLYGEIMKHPFFGIGWGSFWLGPGSASQSIIDKLPWIPYQAHNGYLDILNELGFIGGLLFVLFLFYHCIQLFQLMVLDRHDAAFHCTFLVIILFSNFSESTLYKAVALQHILLIISSVVVSSRLKRID